MATMSRFTWISSSQQMALANRYQQMRCTSRALSTLVSRSLSLRAIAGATSFSTSQISRTGACLGRNIKCLSSTGILAVRRSYARHCTELDQTMCRR
ncbi:unnamed protein product [Symbiodinium pilosum]|uniref:Uncharacterized protein n=1 Tax=Symbiodinium pilosum TaxID=2952 RepID=A0A812LWH9_SYMPI|nr:unnamed protein product [Symbiodinium pilosum]